MNPKFKIAIRQVIRMAKSNRGSMSLSESLALKTVSLLLAIILWITILGFKREEIKKSVRFEPMLPAGMVVTAKIPREITFTLSGPRVLLRDVEKKIQPIRPDLKFHREAVNVITISEEEFVGDLPNGVKVVNIDPPKVIIPLEEMIEKYILVRPTFIGSPAPGFELANVKISPAKVAVAGPRSLVQSLDFVGTEPIDVQDLKNSKDGSVSVVVDTGQGFQLSRDKVVQVRVMLRRIQSK